MPVFPIPHQSVDALKRHLLASALAIGLFVVLLLAVVYVPGLAQWDAYLSEAVQSLRSASLDRFMLAVTLLGDLQLALLLSAVVLATLLYQRRWWLATHLSCVGLSAMLGVSLIKSTLARERPDAPGIIMDSFSFPSGHACTAAVAWGLVALLLAHDRPTAERRRIHVAGFATVAAIAFSRVYLQVHWPSDVVAGMALGYGLLAAFSWQLHAAPALRLPTLWIRLATVGIISALYLAAIHQSQSLHYSITSATVSTLLHSA